MIYGGQFTREILSFSSMIRGSNDLIFRREKEEEKKEKKKKKKEKKGKEKKKNRWKDKSIDWIGR